MTNSSGFSPCELVIPAGSSVQDGCIKAFSPFGRLSASHRSALDLASWNGRAVSIGENHNSRKLKIRMLKSSMRSSAAFFQELHSEKALTEATLRHLNQAHFLVDSDGGRCWSHGVPSAGHGGIASLVCRDHHAPGPTATFDHLAHGRAIGTTITAPDGCSIESRIGSIAGWTK
eukprot:TRINITY_DN76892_c0_g1_i1.p1 TRINITY_DN76892_c0_g1~~TRINITY_DN76892_c0_g1_i1.p1  ORF type:complete len:174 (+),score=16.83 TRINITY_DN76892_c0_g1_i1:406-927(+)